MASLEDDLGYLSPSFDPSSLTMPRLRNILMSHEIGYPASAKKPQLVDIFTQELKPKGRRILAARDKVRRTSRGITDMPSSQEGTVNGDDVNESSAILPPPAPKQRKSRQSTRASAEAATLHKSGASTTPSTRRSSSKHARQSDTESERNLDSKRLSLPRSQKSEAKPRVKVKESSENPARPPLRGGVFSDENPFQSGSSPMEPVELKQNTLSSSYDKRKSSSGRRKTDTALSSARQNDGFQPPTSKTFEVPVSRLQHMAANDELGDSVGAGEDFTPEEQLELVRERAAQGKRDILPPRRIKRPQKSGAIPKSAPWVIIMALLGGYGTWWRQEKLAIGYCDIGRPADALSNVQMPAWASFLQPTCEPCPQHAICYEGMVTRCEHDFIIQTHPLSIGGIVPLAPTCEPDGEKARKFKVIADRAIEELRERKAQVECGKIKVQKGNSLPEEIDEQDLKKQVSKKRRRGLSDAEFDDLWKGAIGEIKGRDEITASPDGTHLRTNSLARLAITCAIRRSARLALARHIFPLSAMTLLALGLLYTRSAIRTSRSDTARVPSLVAMTLDRLATQAAIYAHGDAAESWISVGQLRDDVLRDEFSDRRRENMWKRVRVVVERNANVRASVREGRGGDVSRVWEWIGSVGLIDRPSSGGRRSGGGDRESFGALVKEGTPVGLVVPNGGEIVEQRTWNEGRPVY